MVRLTKIYTRTGDGGKTRLGDMSETTKTDVRVEAYGSVDEANSAIGLARAALTGGDPVDAVLSRVQNDLFDVGADLCVPDRGEKRDWEALRVTAVQVTALERDIDAFNAKLNALDSFILPGGSEAAARLHLARAILRRAERRTVGLRESGEPVSDDAIKYLNRASDLLFVLARIANDEGRADVKWVPGGQR
ncbi:MAG: ATP:cob(I)alamin adenosyltransferase [Maricaulis sp.]|jgi:cob(I)alamin adenosyltransferase|nr:ATP:cob(I)alamin adenosyltransferase [Maricaulis sp.]HAQ34411.1 cob(I)yrinic acid a,c-diamide adenosyltransferase [Alphaproteobacteria bacterium]|tara:strand:+ start:203 stop:778 length:576 start_codon:yes stop_codon:yes gene_type:complete